MTENKIVKKIMVDTFYVAEHNYACYDLGNYFVNHEIF